MSTTVVYNEISHEYGSDESVELLTVLEFIEQFQYPIDKLYIDRFWASIHNDDWVVVDHEMLQWIGYSCARAADNKRKYVLLLEGSFKYVEHYKHANTVATGAGDINVTANNHLLVHPKAFKKTLMMLRTDKGEQIRDYYLALEQVMIDYLRYTSRVTAHNQLIKSSQLEQQVEQYKAEMDQLKSFQVELAELSLDTTPVELSEYVYVLTSKRYYPLNLFKIGKTINLKGRLSVYNTGNVLADDEQFYLCVIRTSDSAALEKQLHRLLNAFLYRKEWYRIHTSDLLKLVQFVTAQQEASKVLIDQMISTQTDPKPDISLEEFVAQSKMELPDHSGYTMKDNKYSCSNCNKDYINLGGMKNHINSHACAESKVESTVEASVDQLEEKLPAPTGYFMKGNKYFCSGCNKDYIKLGGMKNHINSQSCKKSKVGSFECPQCNKLFAVQHYYDKHVADNNCVSQTYTCEKCSKDYSSKKCYENHLAEGCKKFHCDKCGLQFTSNYNLMVHSKRKTPCMATAIVSTPVVDNRRQHSVYKFLNQMAPTDYGPILVGNLYDRYVLYCGKATTAISKCAVGLLLNKHGINTVRMHKGRAYDISFEGIQEWNAKYLE